MSIDYPYSTHSIPTCLPSNLTSAQFLEEYWQKKPLLIKQGLPLIVGLFEPEDILGLASDEDATVRLLTQTGSAQSGKRAAADWHIRTGHLTDYDAIDQSDHWTVLIQNMEQWSIELAALWQAFDYIPQWQRDDIMVSYAPDGGSVGMHYDDYDVFLVQGYGQRRWQLGKFCDDTTPLQPNQPLRLLTDMGSIVLNETVTAGDVLYIPPKMAHYGVAQGDCLTFSFGFRRPSSLQVLDYVIDACAALSQSSSDLTQPLILPQHSQDTGRLSDNSIDAIKTRVLETLSSEPTVFADAVARWASERQYELLQTQDNEISDDNDTILAQVLAGALVVKEPAIKLIYIKHPTTDSLKFYVNGEHLPQDLDDHHANLLKRLADGDILAADDLAGVDASLLQSWSQQQIIVLIEDYPFP